MELNVGIEGFRRGMSIKEVTVPEEMQHRIKTGLAYIDDALGQDKHGVHGCMPSSVIFFTGVPGGGKTTLMLQLADSIAGIHGSQSILFNTAEESLYQTKLMSDRLRLRHGFVAGQDRLVDDILSHADEVNAKVIVVDSLQTLWDDIAVKRGGTNSRTPTRVLQQLTDWAKSNYKVVVAIGQVAKNGQFKGDNTLKHIVDVHLHLDINQDEKSDIPIGVRMMEVQKNRFGCGGLTYFLKMCESGGGLREIAGMRTSV